MPSATRDSLKLRALLESLPQELYDEIFNLVTKPFLASKKIITSKTKSTITIDSNYKPPKALQLCHQIRHRFAIKYYTTNKFVGEEKWLFKWVRTLSKNHIALDHGIWCIAAQAEHDD